MKSQVILSQAKKRCSELLISSPNFYPLQSVMEQILYIEAVLGDKDADRDKLGNINIGLFAVREFEARAPDFADLLYQVEDIVELMKSGEI